MATSVLIVDDEMAIRDSIKIVLDDEGYKTDKAGDGEAALAKIKENNYDVIITDIKMPNMDGLEATREIKKTNPEIPIVAQTAYAMENDERLSLEAGCNSYLSKPIKATKLIETLSTFLMSD
ncbi:MAG: response regulator [Bacteroidales bacterium]|nr:response regulator [Bacteroidales bacterium]